MNIITQYLNWDRAASYTVDTSDEKWERDEAAYSYSIFTYPSSNEYRLVVGL